MFEEQSNIREVVRDLKFLLQKRIPTASLRGLLATAKRVQKRMQQPGKPITYPVQWDSVRQRRAFFASNGFGGGIPYRRTGRYEQGWQLKPVENGFELQNRTRAARFVGGLRSGREIGPGKKQSTIHQGRWTPFRSAADEELRRLHEDVLNALNRETS
jgi:hypothetical protein